eukprot:5992911-Amphidinium_carterae.1
MEAAQPGNQPYGQKLCDWPGCLYICTDSRASTRHEPLIASRDQKLYPHPAPRSSFVKVPS